VRISLLTVHYFLQKVNIVSQPTAHLAVEKRNFTDDLNDVCVMGGNLKM
jgi:hypothetical protein